MKYMLLLYGREDDFDSMKSADQRRLIAAFAHIAGRIEGATNWTAIVQLYDKLQELTESAVVAVNRCAAMVHTEGAQAALLALEGIADNPQIQGYQPSWATRAHVLELADRPEEARQAYMRAIGLTSDPGVRDFLLSRCPEADAAQNASASSKRS